MSEVSENRFVEIARGAAGLAGLAAIVSLVMVLAGEITRGQAFMGSSMAVLAGWLSFVAAALLVLGIAGLVVRFGAGLSRAGTIALAVLTFATAMTVGAASTLALVVPTLAERAPAIAADPPAVVPATFILSGLVMGISGIVLAVAVRKRAGWLPRWTTVLLTVGSVVAIVPLPSRYFLLAFAVAGLLGASRSGAVPGEQSVPRRGVTV